MKIKLVAICTLLSSFAFSQKTDGIKNKQLKKNATTSVLQESEFVVEVGEQEEQYKIIAKKIIQKNGWISNRNSAFVRGIEGFVKGVYVNDGKLFVLIEVANRTNINYDVETISFITDPIQVRNRQIAAEEKIFSPIYSIQTETIAKKSKERLVFVFDKFTISDNKNLLFVMSEIDGERTLTLEVKPKYIVGAEYVK